MRRSVLHDELLDRHRSQKKTLSHIVAGEGQGEQPFEVEPLRRPEIGDFCGASHLGFLVRFFRASIFFLFESCAPTLPAPSDVLANGRLVSDLSSGTK